MRALSYFETCVVNTNLALKAHDAAGRVWIPTTPRAFDQGDGSPAQRLNSAYNAIKHFDDNVEKEKFARNSYSHVARR